MAILAYIGMGSNLGDSRKTFQSAMQHMAMLAVDRHMTVSPLYQTQPLGPQEQPDYLNAVAGMRTELPVTGLLHALQEVECTHHRQRGKERWGPRTLDLDILLYGDARINEDRLVVPHPQMHKRRFVLQPLYELAGDIEIPGKGMLSSLLLLCDDHCVGKIDESV